MNDFTRRNVKYCAWLVAPGVGLIQGGGFMDRHQAKVGLEDRQANGTAFPGERVARVPVRVVDSWHRPRVNLHGGHRIEMMRQAWQW